MNKSLVQAGTVNQNLKDVSFPFLPMMVSYPRSPKSIAALILRVSFGLSLLFVGITHYQTMGSFTAMVSDGLGPIQPLGIVWSYIMPGLMIVGGALLAVHMYMDYATWAAGLALGSIPAGMLLKPLLSPIALPDMMPAAINAFIWLIVFMFVVKCACCEKTTG